MDTLAALAVEWGCAPATSRRVAELVARRFDAGIPAGDRARLLALVDVIGFLGGSGDGHQEKRLTATLRGVGWLGRRVPPLGLGLRVLREATLLHGEWAAPWKELTEFGEAAQPAEPDPRPSPASSDALLPPEPHPPPTWGSPDLGSEVCVVGSGAGGSMVACRLAEAGMDVVVLEAGKWFHESTFPDDEATALRELYWRGGYVPTADGNVTLVAGSTVGGGTTVNWMNCVPPSDEVLEEWTRHGVGETGEHSLTARVGRVLELLRSTDICSRPTGANARLEAGARELGWSAFRARLNLDPARYSPWAAGRAGLGDRSGAKMDARHSLLPRASAAGARIFPRARAHRILRENGKTVGVAGHWTDPGGLRHPFRVTAPVVVVACGALETPALLLRSSLGGRAVGRHLHLHPVAALSGIYAHAQDPWMGPPQTVVVDEFRSLEAGYGFLLETPQFGLGVLAAALPWKGVEEHRRLLALARHTCTFLGLVRDRGSGAVTLDGRGEARIRYSVQDPLDRRHLQQAREAMAKLQSAAGAQELWEPGDNGWPLFSAHQMGSARMGPDPRTAPADTKGELYDAPGVWVGDTSAFPSAVGANPMVTCMALADRTADAILAGRGRTSW
ncbi:MAG: GMC family oxidoreductase [Gemmatimonadota bacterium]